jgi:hypothetical protein
MMQVFGNKAVDQNTMEKNMLRPLGSLEHFYWLLNRGVGIQVVFAAEIAGVATPRAWRAAFDALQQRHPLLRVRIAATPVGSPYLETVHEQPIPLRHAHDAVWSADGIATEWLNAALARELDEPIQTDGGPLMRAVVASAQERSVLILTCNHAVCDAIAIAYCVRDLLRALNGEALVPLSMPPSLNQLLCEGDSALPTMKISLDVVRPACRALPIIHRLNLSRELTGRIVECARDNGTTMHGALCSALLKSGLSTMRQWRNKQIRVATPIDLRRQYGIKDDCGLFTTGAKATLAPGFDGPFWDVARGIMRATNVKGARESVRESTRRMSELLANGLDASGAMQFRRTSLQRDITLSNLGPMRFASPVGPFQLTGLWGPSSPIGPADDQDTQVVGMSTVNGSAHLMLTSLAPARSFLEIAHEQLVQACAS